MIDDTDGSHPQKMSLNYNSARLKLATMVKWFILIFKCPSHCQNHMAYGYRSDQCGVLRNIYIRSLKTSVVNERQFKVTVLADGAEILPLVSDGKITYKSMNVQETDEWSSIGIYQINSGQVITLSMEISGIQVLKVNRNLALMRLHWPKYWCLQLIPWEYSKNSTQDSSHWLLVIMLQWLILNPRIFGKRWMQYKDEAEVMP